MRKTKIVCTLGPATDDENVLRQLMLEGMSVARMNFSHGSHEEHQKKIDTIKKVRKALGLPIAIMLDTKGPEYRIKTFENGKITYPVKGASLIGNGKDILMNIDKVSNNLERAQGMCGSASGSIPVDVGQPAIRVSSITVGGTSNE